MNAPDQWLLPDVQAITDRRNIYINQVGVKSLVHPVRIAGANGGEVATVATVDMTVGLPPEVKGTHMSRFVEVLQQHEHALPDGEGDEFFKHDRRPAPAGAADSRAR